MAGHTKYQIFAAATLHALVSFVLVKPFYFHPIYYIRPFNISLLVVTQIRGHISSSSPPLPNTVRALHFYREKISALSSLVDTRRIVLIHARRYQQLIPSFFWQIN